MEKKYEYTAFGLMEDDEQKALKQAEKAGKTIQVLSSCCGWQDLSGSHLWYSGTIYRVKPEEKPPGKQWTQETCPFPCMVRHVDRKEDWRSIGEIRPDTIGAYISDCRFISFEELAREWEHRVMIDGEWVWKRCRTEGVGV